MRAAFAQPLRPCTRDQASEKGGLPLAFASTNASPVRCLAQHRRTAAASCTVVGDLYRSAGTSTSHTKTTHLDC